MLDDRERRALADLERQLAQADPEFAGRMGHTDQDVPFPVVPVLCAVLFICVPLVMLLFGWLGVVVALDLFAVAVVVVLVRRRSGRARGGFPSAS